LAKAVSISIEGEMVKAVAASVTGRKTRVTNTLVFPIDQLDDFLTQEPVRDFIVSVDFHNIYQDVVYLPPVSRRLAKKLLRAELKKKNPALEGHLSTVFFRTGQKNVNGSNLDEYFVFFVDNAEIDGLVERFLVRGKRLKALYPNMLAVLKILPTRQKPYICHYETGDKKNLFLISNGKVLFTRSAPSIGAGVLDYDLQNINMTVNYCRQTLRIEPEQVLFVGEADKTSASAAKPAIPLVFLNKPEQIAVESEVFSDFLIPISALGAGETQSLFTDEYRAFYAASTVVQKFSGYFAVLALLLVATLVMNFAIYRTLHEGLGKSRLQESQLQQTLAENGRAKQALLDEKPRLEYLNRQYAAPSAAQLLYRLARLQVQEMEVQKLEISAQGGDTLKLHMTGQMRQESLLRAQQSLAAVMAGLTGINGVTATGRLSLKDRTFDIDGSYAEGSR
jgi:hypothetical protein